MGARFTFTIPTGEEAGSGTANGPAPLSTRSSRRMMGEHARILAVDDDPQALRYVRDALASAGYTPVVTGDPAEALRLVAEEKADLVLFDLMLPGTDGIELMKDILGAGDVPVIFLSTYGQCPSVMTRHSSSPTPLHPEWCPPLPGLSSTGNCSDPAPEIAGIAG